MTDETTDIINKEQFVICISWVDKMQTKTLMQNGNKDLNTNKDFIGLHELNVTNANTFAFFLKDVVLGLGLDPERLRTPNYN